ncbi:sirohydrochlorin chelatase [Salibacterium halotolerans]|uniref:Sirohydrochlorin ferrochelatase n=1 Tax=Salibacterium halotolerans TaxID=1884432 RepID=A0A1I5RI00_9BACI|nr:sirohydrochlorin chelatase [Salibacterium halotolerans]SFP58163.1 sirohydrochlorin ferrochelatase [Salibacterium halotolerans]
MRAVLYVGHGTRVPEGSRQMEAFVEETKKSVPCTVQETCFLELSEPDIAEGARRCVEQGADTITVVPVLLFAAGHIKEDIPAELQKVQNTYPHLTIQYGAPFGLHPKMLDVLMVRLKAQGWTTGEDADILLVGRGSSDKNALQDFYRIAGELEERTGKQNVKTAFLAAASPSFDEGLAAMSQSRARRVYAVPYLMFTGLLMQEMQEKIDKMNETGPPEMKLCDYLGYDEELQEVLKQRTLETMEQPAWTEWSGEHV